MDIGTESPTIVIEPLEHPVPGKSIPAPAEPVYTPAPTGVPELVPA